MELGDGAASALAQVTIPMELPTLRVSGGSPRCTTDYPQPGYRVDACRTTRTETTRRTGYLMHFAD